LFRQHIQSCFAGLAEIQPQIETSAKRAIRRSGVPAERRISLEIEGFGFLPKAATLLLQRSQIV
jgi:hypothetical protein